MYIYSKYLGLSFIIRCIFVFTVCVAIKSPTNVLQKMIRLLFLVEYKTIADYEP